MLHKIPHAESWCMTMEKIDSLFKTRERKCENLETMVKVYLLLFMAQIVTEFIVAQMILTPQKYLAFQITYPIMA